MSGEDAPRPCAENLIVLEIKTNKQSAYNGQRRVSSPIQKVGLYLTVCSCVKDKTNM
jgi:hypothetical protein